MYICSLTVKYIAHFKSSLKMNVKYLINFDVVNIHNAIILDMLDKLKQK